MPLSLGDRQLLTVVEVCKVLRRTTGWFYKHRKTLEARDFPKPVLGGCYDPRAVQAWLDAQMSPRLLAVLQAQAPTPEATIDWEKQLRENAERIAGDLPEKHPPVH